MWGRWSYIGARVAVKYVQPVTGLRESYKTAINEALRRMKKSGISKPELEAFFREILAGKNKSGPPFCTDDEGLLIDKVLGAVLITVVTRAVSPAGGALPVTEEQTPHSGNYESILTGAL